MTTYKWLGLVIAFAFGAAWYASVRYGVPDIWIVVAFGAMVIWAAVGLVKTIDNP